MDNSGTLLDTFQKHFPEAISGHLDDQASDDNRGPLQLASSKAPSILVPDIVETAKNRQEPPRATKNHQEPKVASAA